MTRTEATADLNKMLGRLSDEQVAALVAMAQKLAAAPMDQPEDDDARSAVAEGVAQAKRRDFVSAARADELLNKPWR